MLTDLEIKEFEEKFKAMLNFIEAHTGDSERDNLQSFISQVAQNHEWIGAEKMWDFIKAEPDVESIYWAAEAYFNSPKQ